MKYNAIFFDRDGTLTYFNPEKEKWRDLTIESRSGKPFELSYVDDCHVEADGAREQGFTSFLIDRSGLNKEAWTITSLKQLVDYVEVLNG